MICSRTLSGSSNPTAYLNLLSKSTTLNQCDQIHAQIILNGLQNNLITSTKLIHKLSHLGSIERAHRLFATVSEPDVFLFNVLIRSFSQSNQPISAVTLYADLLRKPALKPNNYTFSFAISAASSSKDIGRLLHAHSIVCGFELDPFIGSVLAEAYFNFLEVANAQKVFDKIPEPDTVLWNTLISGLAWNCCFERSICAFERMVLCGIQFDSNTLVAVLPVAAELQDLRFGMKVHCLAEKSGLRCSSHVLTGLVSMYSKCGQIEVSRFLFGQIEGPDLVSWNAMISGCSRNGDVEASVGLFRELLIRGGKVNSSTVVGLIPVHSPFGHMGLSQSIHSFSIKSGIDVNSPVSTALTTIYSRLNDMESAQKLFDETTERSLASWNAIISGYAQNGLTEMAISLFKQMEICNVRPNPTTVTSILSACAQIGALTLGKRIHELVLKENFESNVFVSTALIDMYAKCGSIDESQRVFDEMPVKNVVSWNAMIFGYGLHGRGREALNLFTKMLNARINPTGITFLSILYACSHAGLVNVGLSIFDLMVHDHGVKPSPQHFACMVDLLGRAGRLDEAFEFINTMPVKPGSGVWGALLGACMKHKNPNLARVASEKLFEFEPENVGYHILLSNIHSVDRNFSEASIVRQAVKSKKLAKTPGCTLIEIDETLHIFTAGDRSHARSEEIYAMLEELVRKMTEAGFRPETDVALYDVEEEEKENMVKVHSEKLAIAFGLISTDSWSEIRIIKNLRVCLDCHNATKFISKITQRVIVVRDANRFHHFRDGVCSCGDYW